MVYAYLKSEENSLSMNLETATWLVMEITNGKMSIINVDSTDFVQNEDVLAMIFRMLKQKSSFPLVKLDENGVKDEVRHKKWRGEFDIKYDSTHQILLSKDHKIAYKGVISNPFDTPNARKQFRLTLKDRLPVFKIIDVDRFADYFAQKYDADSHKCWDAISNSDRDFFKDIYNEDEDDSY